MKHTLSMAYVLLRFHAGYCLFNDNVLLYDIIMVNKSKFVYLLLQVLTPAAN